MASAGVRPRDWDLGLVERAAKVVYPPAFVLAAKTCILRYWLDQKNVPRATSVLEDILSAIDGAPTLLRGDAAAEAAFFLSFFCHDPARARQYLKDARSPFTEPHRLLRAEAAVLLRSTDATSARQAIENALVALRTPRMEATGLDRDLIAAVGRELGVPGSDEPK
jgi:hypothetical protein